MSCEALPLSRRKKAHKNMSGNAFNSTKIKNIKNIIILTKRDRFRINAGKFKYFAIYTQEVAIAIHLPTFQHKEFLRSFQKETKQFLTNTI
jgi:hypothetical protein